MGFYQKFHIFVRPVFFLLIKVFLTFDSDQLETNGQRHRDPLIRLPNHIFNLESRRPRDRKLGHLVGFGQ